VYKYFKEMYVIMHCRVSICFQLRIELCHSNLSGIVGNMVSKLMTRENFSSDIHQQESGGDTPILHL
jgi:hypothetical protein